MPRTGLWLLLSVLALAGCTGIVVALQDRDLTNPPSVINAQQDVLRDDALHRCRDRHPKRAAECHLGPRRPKTYVHDTVWMWLAVEFQAAFGHLVSRHALPPPEDLITGLSPDAGRATRPNR